MNTDDTDDDSSDGEPWRDPDILEEMAVERGLTPTQIGDELGCSQPTVSRWMSKHDVGAHICDVCGDSFATENGLNIHIGQRHDLHNAECPTCGESFPCDPHRMERSENNFCSPECHDEFRRERLDYECEYCGSELEKIPSREKYDDHHFCGWECSRLWHREENHWNWKGGKLYITQYGDNWVHQRRKARERDGFECRMCGQLEEDYGRELDVHHIRPIKQFPTPEEANRLDNLLTLCRSCHRIAEKMSPLRPETTPN